MMGTVDGSLACWSGVGWPVDDDAPTLEDAQAALREVGISSVLEGEHWCWHVVGCRPGHRPRVHHPDTGQRLYLSRWLLDHYGQLPLGSKARWYPEICEDPTCVNPVHWFPRRQYPVRTPTRSGRSIYASSGHRSDPPLRATDLIAIRAKRREGYTLSELAVEYGRARSTISKIVNFRDNYGFEM
jgi:hypothetical protein